MAQQIKQIEINIKTTKLVYDPEILLLHKLYDMFVSHTFFISCLFYIQ